MPEHQSEPPFPVGEEPSLRGVPKMSRRRFGHRAAQAAMLSLSSPALLHARQDESVPKAKPKRDDSLGLTPEQTQDVEARLANIIRKYGSRLSGEQREHLRRILTYNEKMLAAVRAFPLQNGDPPASVLRVSLSREPLAAGKRRAAAGQGTLYCDETQQVRAEEGKI